MQQDNGRLCYSCREAAQLLGLSKNACYAACSRGQIPVLRIGKRLLIPKARLDALLRGTGEAGEARGTKDA